MTPLQINAGTAMGEATTAQGFIPLLYGTGKNLIDGSSWDSYSSTTSSLRPPGGVRLPAVENAALAPS